MQHALWNLRNFMRIQMRLHHVSRTLLCVLYKTFFHSLKSSPNPNPKEVSHASERSLYFFADTADAYDGFAAAAAFAFVWSGGGVLPLCANDIGVLPTTENIPRDERPMDRKHVNGCVVGVVGQHDRTVCASLGQCDDKGSQYEAGSENENCVSLDH